MGLGLRDSRQQRRRQMWWRVWKWVFVSGGILAAGGYAYQTGSILAEKKVEFLQSEITQLTGKVSDLQTRNGDLSATIAMEREKIANWESRYRNDVPSGDLKILFERIRDKVKTGVKTDRLTFVIDQVANKRSCDDAVNTKRFIAQTRLFKGTNDSVSFADKTITVTAMGESAANAAGAPEAWYDPAAPLTVNFVLIGGETKTVTGKFPLHKSVVINDREHRFTLTAANSPGFVLITHDTCAYP